MIHRLGEGGRELGRRTCRTGKQSHHLSMSEPDAQIEWPLFSSGQCSAYFDMINSIQAPI